MSTGRRAIFLDRDGVINDCVDRGEDFFVAGKKVRWTSPWTYDEFRLKGGVMEALGSMGDLGFLRILVTNQPDVSYGMMRADEFDRIMSYVNTLAFDGIYVCTHRREAACECKKPKVGMFLQAAREHKLDLRTSVVIGDSIADILPAKELGCVSILMNGPNAYGVSADWYVQSLSEAVNIIKKRI